MRWETYEDQAGEWRWRAIARNGKVVADGAEGYATKRNANRALTGFQAALREPPEHAPSSAPANRCQCGKPQLSKVVTSLCTGCGLIRG